MLCIQLSRMSHEAVCDQLGIDKGHFSRMLSGRANFSVRKINTLARVCGNVALLQWMANDLGYELTRKAEPQQQQERGAPWARSA